MISHEHRAIFVHIPKTAGTSIEAAFGHHGAGGIVRNVQDHRTLRQVQGLRPHRSTVASVENMAEVGRVLKARWRPPAHAANRLRVTPAQYASYLKFAVVRDPWERVWSWYRNVVTDPDHRARLGIAPGAGFAELVPAQLGRDMLRPQTYWLRDFDGRIGVDVVCRYERLAADVADVFARLDAPLALPHLNDGGAARPYAEVYDDATRRLVGDFYREEIAIFGYRFGGAPAG